MDPVASLASRAVGAVAAVLGARGSAARLWRVALVVVVAALVVGATPGGVGGQDRDDNAGEVEVRIVARRVAGERVEFALQQQASLTVVGGSACCRGSGSSRWGPGWDAGW